MKSSASFPPQPMLAVLSSLPSQEEDKYYGYEMKWDGIRALISIRKDQLRIATRNQHDVTATFPELLPIVDALSKRGVTSCLLDGEIVALTARGVPSFQLLQTRLGVTTLRTSASRSKSTPATLMIFDLLELNGKDITRLPYEKRRHYLESLGLNGAAWRTPPMHIGDGARILKISQKKNLEGVVAKKLSSPYTIGKRSTSWRKIKLHAGQELVIGGYTRGKGKREKEIGALLVGYFDKPRSRSSRRTMLFQYAGRVGTGFSDSDLVMLRKRLRPLIIKSNPFSTDPLKHPSRGQRLHLENIVYVRPTLVGQFRFAEWTANGTLRQASYLGIREDKKVKDVVREDRPRQ